MSYRILIFGMSSNSGGIESFLMNYVNNLDRNKVKITFLNLGNSPIAYSDYIKKMGCKIIDLKLVKRRQHPFRYKKELNIFLKRNVQRFDCIWFNFLDLSAILWVKEAKKNGFSRIIVHAHNSSIMLNGIRGQLLLIRHCINRKLISKYATDLWACSSTAGKWFYGDKSKFKIINNAIDVDKFKYNLQKRKKLREKISISPSTFVIGNVGRLQYQKNQKFLISLFESYLKYNSNSKLILVGQGEDYKLLNDLVNKKGLSDYVIFAGEQSDIQAWLSAFDLFVFPSHFEGLPIAGLEAQANGLPIIAANDGIPKELKINSNFTFLSLKDSISKWCQTIQNMKGMSNKRENFDRIKHNFRENNFDINFIGKVWNNF